MIFVFLSNQFTAQSSLGSSQIFKASFAIVGSEEGFSEDRGLLGWTGSLGNFGEGRFQGSGSTVVGKKT